MSLVTQALGTVESRLPKVIDARTHGMIDYGHATFFLGMALLCRRKNPRAALAALHPGSFVLAAQSPAGGLSVGRGAGAVV